MNTRFLSAVARLTLGVAMLAGASVGGAGAALANGHNHHVHPPAHPNPHHPPPSGGQHHPRHDPNPPPHHDDHHHDDHHHHPPPPPPPPDHHDNYYYHNDFYFDHFDMADVMMTAMVVGTVVAALPSNQGCNQVQVNGYTYADCNGTWYAPHYEGNDLVWVVVSDPR